MSVVIFNSGKINAISHSDALKERFETKTLFYH